MIGWLRRMLAPSATDDFWYSPIRRESASGVDVSDEVAMTYSAVWACTRILSATGASLPWNLMRRRGNQIEVAANHPVQRILHNLWNDETLSLMGRSAGIGQQINNGNAYAEIERDMIGRPVRLWPVHYSRVTPLRADDQMASALSVQPKSLVYRVRNDAGMPPSFVPNRDMFAVPSMVSTDGICGKGVIENARDSIGMGLATERQGASYHKRGRPNYAIIGGKFKEKEDRDYFRMTWETVHAESGRPALLPEGADLKVLGFSQEDQQFLETRRHNVEEIARWYGVPPHMIQDLSRATFSNIEHQAIDFVVYSLIPWLELWDKVAWHKLLTPFEQRTMFAKHNVAGLLRGDTKARSEFYEKLWQLGVLSIDEIREKEDMNPLGEEAGGDKRFVQTSYTTLDAIGREQEPMPEPEMPEDDDENEGESEDEDTEDETGNLSAKLDDLITYVRAIPQERTIPQEQNGHARKADDREERLAAAALVQVEDALRRARSRETKALQRAAKKQPPEFFIWLDDFCGEHQEILANELTLPLQSYEIASGVAVSATEAATEFVATTHEQVLRATEIQPEEWGTLPQRIADLDWSIILPDCIRNK